MEIMTNYVPSNLAHSWMKGSQITDRKKTANLKKGFAAMEIDVEIATYLLNGRKTGSTPGSDGTLTQVWYVSCLKHY